MTFDEGVIRAIRERQESLRDVICNGSIPDFMEYKRIVGELRGLALAVDIVEDLADRMRKADD